MNQPVVSIITVCKNSADTIADTIESVLNQTYRNIEYIIVDGVSTDNTLNILRSYEDKFKARNSKYTVVSEKDKNLYDAMNKGIRLSSGEIVGIINGDDWYETDAVETIIKSFSQTKDIGIAYGLLRLFKQGKECDVIGKSHDFLHETMINHPTCFIKRDIYNKYGMYDTNYRIAADYDLILKLKSQGIVFCRIPKIIANFRLGGLTTTSFIRTEREVQAIYRNYGIISKKQYAIKKTRLFISMLMRSFFKKG
jgi:glycosyltransferase involved in cell wall biosynthesis